MPRKLDGRTNAGAPGLGVPETGVPDAATIRAAYQQGVLHGSTPTAVREATSPPTTTALPTALPTTVALDASTPPAPLLNLFRTLEANPDHSTFVDLLLAAGFNAGTEVIGPFTVFAPTNAAFEVLPKGALDTFMTYPEQLRSVLTYHIVEGLLPVSALSGELTTINEATLLVEGDQSALPVGGATIVAPDIAATNGVIHGTSAMLVPPATPKG